MIGVEECTGGRGNGTHRPALKKPSATEEDPACSGAEFQSKEKPTLCESPALEVHVARGP